MDKMKNQVSGLSENEILVRIEKATTVEEMNILRTNCVSFLRKPRGKEILLAWQKKYWQLKNCPACGHSLTEGK